MSQLKSKQLVGSDFSARRIQAINDPGIQNRDVHHPPEDLLPPFGGSPLCNTVIAYVLVRQIHTSHIFIVIHHTCWSWKRLLFPTALCLFHCNTDWSIVGSQKHVHITSIMPARSLMSQNDNCWSPFYHWLPGIVENSSDYFLQYQLHTSCA